MSIRQWYTNKTLTQRAHPQKPVPDVLQTQNADEHTIPQQVTPRQTTQSNIKALDKDANTHNKRPALLGDPPTKRHKQQIQQTIPHQTRRPGLLGERPTNTATYTYNKTNWLSHRNTNTANNTNHPLSSQKSSTHVYQIHKTTYDNTTITLKKLQTPETTQPTQEHNIDATQHNTHNKRNQDTIHITYRHNQGTTTDAHQHTPLTPPT